MHIRTQFPVSEMAGWDGYPGGLVYFKLLGMQVARQYAIPTNPKTANQLLTRSYLTLAAQAFGALSDNERAAWLTFAAAHPRTYLGASYTMQEMAAYVWINWLRQLDAQAITDAAPSIDPDWSITDITAVAYVSGTTTLSLTITHNKAVIANQYVLSRISPALNSAQRHARKSDYRLIEGIAATSIPDLVADAADLVFTSPVFAWTDGQYLDIELIPISEEYVPGTPFYRHGTVTVT